MAHEQYQQPTIGTWLQKNSSNTASNANNKHLGNTHHEPTTNPPTRNIMKRTMAETQRNDTEKPPPRNNKKSKNNTYATSKANDSGKGYKNTTPRRYRPWGNHLTRKEKQTIGKLVLKTHEQKPTDASTQQTEDYTCPTCGKIRNPKKLK